jgi:hypothetical protein
VRDAYFRGKFERVLGMSDALPQRDAATSSKPNCCAPARWSHWIAPTRRCASCVVCV